MGRLDGEKNIKKQVSIDDFKFEKWLNEEKTYVGITRQKLSRRRYQHNHFGGKNFSDLQATHKNLTRNQARALEQYYIEMRDGPNKLNKINSISTKNK